MAINGTNGHGAAVLVGVRSAARALKVNASTISRYLKEHPGLNLGDESLPKVDIEVLRRHRARNVNPALRGIKAAKALATGGGEAPPADTMETSPNYADAKAQRETVLAQRARLDLDEKRGLLVPREEIERATYDAGLLLQRGLLEMGGQLAERIAAMDDTREIAELMETEHRRVLATMATSLRAKADEKYET